MAISSINNGSTAMHNPPRRADETIQTKLPTPPQSTADDAGPSTSSALHSFANGVLGLDDPTAAKPEDAENKSYTAGKFMSALGTIGTIISVLA